MALSNDLISQFVKVTRSEKKTPTESTHFGTAVEYNGKMYVKLDGSDALTPVFTTTDMEPGERVSVLVKNHSATVTGNLSSPAARTDAVKEIAGKVTQVEVLIADRVTTEQLEAEIARIDTLVSDNVTIKDTLTANKAEIDDLKAVDVTVNGLLTAAQANIESLSANKIDASIVEATYATIKELEAINADIYNLNATYGDFVTLTADKFTAIEADISDLDVNKLSASEAKLTYATITNLNAATANITDLSATFANFEIATADKFVATDALIATLEANKLSATDIEGKYANIDFSNISQATMEQFYAKSGLIDNVVIGNGTISGELIGVTIKGDLIEGGTVIADKLVIKGTHGLYYKLNTNGVTTETEQTDYNSLNGSVITAKSITASKISVKDLVAFGATIGGFHISDTSIYSGVKASVDNTTNGVYLDNAGQIAFGNANQFVKFHKKSDGTYALDISADSLSFGSSKTSVESVISDIQNDVDTLIPRVSANETNISKNSEAILLRATKTEVAESLSGYYTKAQTDAAISVKANEITSSVASTYATNASLNTAKADLEQVKTRVGTAESKITQNANGITSLVSRTETVENKFNNYSTTEEMNSAIQQKANSITSSVSSTYATKSALASTDNNVAAAKSELANLEVGGRNYLRNSNFKKVYIGGTTSKHDGLNATDWGGYNGGIDNPTTSYHAHVDQDTFGYNVIEYNESDGTRNWKGINQTLSNIDSYKTNWRISADLYATGTGTKLYGGFHCYLTGETTQGFHAGQFSITPTEVNKWERLSAEVKMPANIDLTKNIRFYIYGYNFSTNSILYMANPSLNISSKTVDWTPAPEDMATDQRVNDVQATVEQMDKDVEDRFEKAESIIRQLSNCIDMLVIDANGTTLLEQTSEGWTFSLSDLNTSVSTASSDLAALKTSTGSTADTVSALEKAVDSLEETAEYVRIGTYESEPCIELGKSGSDFKLMITNTRIMFMRGNDSPTYIDPTGLVTQNITVESEIRQGNIEHSGIWVRKVRTNGNYGLQWKGVTS